MYDIDMIKRSKKKPTIGFTLVEIVVVISVLAILVALSFVSYFGVKKMAAMSSLADSTKKASTALEITHASRPNELSSLVDGGEVATISNKFTSGPDIVTKVYLSEPIGYGTLTTVQNAVLYHTLCSSLTSEKRPDASDLNYGQGRNRDGGVVTFISVNPCNVYNKDRMQINMAWGFAGGELVAPVARADVVSFIDSITHNDSYFPDATHVAKQYHQTVLDRFEAQGGTFPIATFWDGSWCSAGQPWCTAKEDLPEPLSTSDQWYYCVESYHKSYPGDIYKQSSLTGKPVPGQC